MSATAWIVAGQLTGSVGPTVRAGALTPRDVEPAAEVSESPKPMPSTSTLTWRVAIGPSVGWIALGGHARAWVAAYPWRYGAVELGPLMSLHAYRRVDTGLHAYSVAGHDTLTRAGMSLGHAFYLGRGRVRLSSDVYTAVSWRYRRVTITDDAHGVSATSRNDRLAWEHGAACTLGIALTGPWSLQADALLPLFWSGAVGVMRAWQWSTPFVGLSLAYSR